MGTLSKISATTEKIAETVGNVPILSLSKAWIGIGLVSPATTEDKTPPQSAAWDWRVKGFSQKVTSASGSTLDRYDYTQLYSLQIGEYYMPLSQTFQLRAKKRLNVSALVDGPDIIQQTRKEAKTISVSLRISLRDNQPNLQILRDSAAAEVTELATFLQNFYENDAVLAISNEMINFTFGVSHAIITDYTFTPQVGMGTYRFEFSLTEVLFGENVITFNLREIGADTNTP